MSNQHFSMPPCGRLVSKSAGNAHSKAEMLTSEGASLSVLKC
jgi:hypothetical protein